MLYQLSYSCLELCLELKSSEASWDWILRPTGFADRAGILGTGEFAR